ncbi:MAG: magnesium-translocating P-type ATPase [Burkholderiales bacterium]
MNSADQDTRIAITGLTSAEAASRLAQCGRNVLPASRARSALVDYATRFANPLVLLLVVASVVLGFTGDVVGMGIIVVMIGASVTLDFFQEHRAERAIARLQDALAPSAIVVRDGAMTTVPVSELVPGDVVSLRAGDIVPADGRLLSSDQLFVNESTLTGESVPFEKRVGEPDPALAEVKSGTSVANGIATFIVTATGAATAVASIATELATRRPMAPLERGIHDFGAMILRLTFVLVLFVLLASAAMHRPWLQSFLFAVALAVGLTPELLPMVVSVTLARGAMRLARGEVIVKRLSAVYALGSIDVLCTDKTGTLTEATLRVAGSEDAGGNASPHALAYAAVNSRFASGMRSPLDDAIVAAAAPGGKGYRKIAESPFDFARRAVSVLVADPAGTTLLIAKGAPEEIVARCTLREPEREAILARFAALGDQGLRAIAVATRVLPPSCTAVAGEEREGLAFVGFVTFRDPPRADAAHVLSTLAHSGIALKIVTGDNERVARHVCEALGLRVAGVMLGRDIDALPDDALASETSRCNLFCRMSPAQKTRVIRALRARGHAVGFMGDGINDAPAMHAADVGISVQGAAGVAREAADVILTRPHLGVVREGVLEGRRTYGNIMKYLMMVTSSSFGNMISMALATLFLPFLPMLPVQILLNNLLYDVSETAIPFDRVDPADLRRPHAFDVHEIRRFMLAMGPVSSVFDLATFGVLLLAGVSPAMFQTSWFVESMASQLLVIFVIRTSRNPLASRPHPLLVASSLGMLAVATALPLLPVGALFGFVAPPGWLVALMFALVAGYLAVAQVCKVEVHRLHRRRHRPAASP